jgi:arabinan endo-1,5-alpha-L-arabinosidase
MHCMRILTLVSILLLVACQGNVTNNTPSLPSLPETTMTTQTIPIPSPLPTFPATPHPSLEATSALPSLLPLKPVIDRDFPDPDVLRVGETYFAYATNSSRINLQVARSSNLMNWELLPDAMPALPSWAVKRFGYVWAPEVTISPDGDLFILYFTARYALRQGGTQCIGVATSLQPEGPFQPVEHPLICQIEQGGSIDAASFEDGGERYLLWKNDGNSVGGQSWIYIQQLSGMGYPSPVNLPH